MRNAMNIVHKNSLKNIDILYIEDEEELRDIYIDLINKNFSADLVVAENGQTAIEILKQKTFDLIISDLNMSPGNGLDVLKYLYKWDLKIPFIFYCGSQCDTSILKFPFIGHIEKPNFDQLIKLINSTKIAQ